MPVTVVSDVNAFPTSQPIAGIKAFLADTWERAGQGDGFTISSDDRGAAVEVGQVSDLLRKTRAMKGGSQTRPTLTYTLAGTTKGFR